MLAVFVGLMAGAGEGAAPDPVRPKTGSAAPGPARLPTTLAEAEADYVETVRKCGLLGVAAVRDECLREARRVLARETVRLRSAGRPGPAGP